MNNRRKLKKELYKLLAQPRSSERSIKLKRVCEELDKIPPQQKPIKDGKV